MLSEMRLHQTAACGVLMVLFTAMAIEAHSFRDLAKWFPYYFSIAGAVISFIAFTGGLFFAMHTHRMRSKSQPVEAKSDDSESDIRTLMSGLLWFFALLCYVVLVGLLGTYVGTLLAVVLWFSLIHRIPIRNLILAMLATLATLYGLDQILTMPSGFLVG